MFPRVVVITLVGLEIAVSSNSSNYWWKMWSYEDEATWPGEMCQEGGRRQSPIDIKSSAAIKDFRSRFIKYGNLKFIGYNKVLLTGINNGHTIQFSTEGDKSMHPVLTGGPLQHHYRLEQLHFHWLSEHAIDGRKFPMEIHFVHIRADLSVQEALTMKDGLAIISVFCNVIAELNDSQFESSYEYMQYVPQLQETGSRISGILLDVTKVLSSDLGSYFTYSGSLTSPECNEVVTWILFDTPITISDSQYRLFGKVGKGRHNFRSLQPMKFHQVYRPPPASIWTTPYIVNVFTDMYRAFTTFVRNVTKLGHSN